MNRSITASIPSAEHTASGINPAGFVASAPKSAESIPKSIPDDFPGLAEQEQRAEQAGELLERAARTVAALDPGDWREQAARLRVAASDAEHAAQRLRELVGYLEAAHASAVAPSLRSEP